MNNVFGAQEAGDFIKNVMHKATKFSLNPPDAKPRCYTCLTRYSFCKWLVNSPSFLWICNHRICCFKIPSFLNPFADTLMNDFATIPSNLSQPYTIHIMIDFGFTHCPLCLIFCHSLVTYVCFDYMLIVINFWRKQRVSNYFT